jgi:hypothetical protein
MLAGVTQHELGEFVDDCRDRRVKGFGHAGLNPFARRRFRP